MANSKISALTAAATPVAGTEVLPIVQSSATVKLAISDLTPGLSTITAAKGGTGQTTYAVGDTLYASATTTISKLTIGAANTVLTSSGTAPQWSTGLNNVTIGATTATTGVFTTATANSFIPNSATVPTNGMYLSAANTLAFSTNSAYRVSITAGGALYVGTTSVPGAGTTTVGSAVDPNGYLSLFRTNGTSGYFARSNDGEVVALFSGATQRGSISILGAVTTYGSVSDYRLKENIGKINNPLKSIAKLKPCKYNFKEFPASEIEGFIAHEVQEIVPSAVFGEKDAVGENGKANYQSLDMAKLIPLMVAAIQEQQITIESLTARIETLETKS